MKKIIENLLNGKIEDARKQSKNFNSMAIRNYLLSEDWDFSTRKAELAIIFLKTGKGFQAFCDAE
jgi:hypothetical protein